jgi:hypothetical protein
MIIKSEWHEPKILHKYTSKYTKENKTDKDLMYQHRSKEVEICLPELTYTKISKYNP